jgi:hypothetical protein
MPATLIFDKPGGYGPSDVIAFQVVVDPEPMTRTLAVVGTTEAADGTNLPVDQATTIHGVYGPFAADGYDVVQDETDPAKFVATPL